MESGSTTTSTNGYDSHPLPHQQFSSRIAFANNSNTITKVKLNSLSNKKSTRLPPIAKYETVSSPPISQDCIRYFNKSAESCHSLDQMESNCGLDPNLRIKQLEQNIKFVREDCQHLLESLHQELEDLKIKNRDLQFQLITNGSFTSHITQSLTKEQVVIMPLIRGALEPQIGEYITKLENEVKRLTTALGETLKTNAILKQELHKRKNSYKQVMNDSNDKPLYSPTIGDFNKTFEVINKTINSNTMEVPLNLPRIGSTHTTHTPLSKTKLN